MLPDKKPRRDQPTRKINLEHEEPEEQEQPSNEYDQLQQILTRQAAIRAAERKQAPPQRDPTTDLLVTKKIKKPIINKEWSPLDDN